MLLDTHFLVWLTGKPEVLTDRDRALLSREDVEVFASIISLWEIRMKWQTIRSDGTRKGDVSPDSAAALLEESGWAVATLGTDDILERLRAPAPNRDPHDEMLLVHAQRLGAQLLTRDRLLVAHPLAYRFG
ncbi:type II toxin-antitoxin system VapC family toxin [Sphingomonas gilva]|uniref:type II toxin-antitoxin system VapC family toxin n=1 Tax=Sphingomonas gilva TaxID=2305907 RepID=UPI001CA40072|nr:PIN domain-containing protein [Sphingomonas gilva]